MKSLKFLLVNNFKVKSILNRDAIYTAVRKIQSWDTMHCVNDANHYLCYSLFRILNKLLVFTYLPSSYSCFPGLGQFSCVIPFLSLSRANLASAKQHHTTPVVILLNNNIQKSFPDTVAAPLPCEVHICTTFPPPGESSQTEHTTATARWTFSIYKWPNSFHWNLYSSLLSCFQSSVSSSLPSQVSIQGDYNCSCPFRFKKHHGKSGVWVY